jgi:hypothetical protein
VSAFEGNFNFLIGLGLMQITRPGACLDIQLKFDIITPYSVLRRSVVTELVQERNELINILQVTNPYIGLSGFENDCQRKYPTRRLSKVDCSESTALDLDNSHLLSCEKHVRKSPSVQFLFYGLKREPDDHADHIVDSFLNRLAPSRFETWQEIDVGAVRP